MNVTKRLQQLNLNVKTQGLQIRLSKQMKQILLALLQEHPNRNLTLWALTWKIIGYTGFCGWRSFGRSYRRSYVARPSIHVSFTRSLQKLVHGKLIAKIYDPPDKGQGRYVYFLTEQGHDVAKSIHNQIKEFMLEWQKLL